MKDNTYDKKDTLNDYFEVWHSEEYDQFLIVDLIEDTEECYTIEEFNFLTKVFNTIIK